MEHTKEIKFETNSMPWNSILLQFFLSRQNKYWRKSLSTVPTLITHHIALPTTACWVHQWNLSFSLSAQRSRSVMVTTLISSKKKNRIIRENPRLDRLTQEFFLGAVAITPHLAESVSLVVGEALPEAGVEARLVLLVDGGGGFLGAEGGPEDEAHEKHCDKLVECHLRILMFRFLACLQVFLWERTLGRGWDEMDDEVGGVFIRAGGGWGRGCWEIWSRVLLSLICGLLRDHDPFKPFFCKNWGRKMSHVSMFRIFFLKKVFSNDFFPHQHAHIWFFFLSNGWCEFFSR